MEKLESRAIVFQAFGGLSNVNTSAELKYFSFNQVLKQCQHHPSIMAQGSIQKTPKCWSVVPPSACCKSQSTHYMLQTLYSLTGIKVVLLFFPKVKGVILLLFCEHFWSNDHGFQSYLEEQSDLPAFSHTYGLHSALKSGSKLPNPQQLFSETSISYHSVSSIRTH